MDQYGEAVLDYLCGVRERFVNAQFTLPKVGLVDGKCPDFVVVDFVCRRSSESVFFLNFAGKTGKDIRHPYEVHYERQFMGASPVSMLSYADLDAASEAVRIEHTFGSSITL
jgi:hypothetical protein